MAKGNRRNMEVVPQSSTEDGEGHIAATSKPSQAVRDERISQADLEILQQFHQDMMTAERAMQSLLRSLSARYKLIKPEDSIDIGTGKIIRA